MDDLLNILHSLTNVEGMIEWGGLIGISLIVFAETGLFIGFFLPGDSLLVTAGVFAATGTLDLSLLLTLVVLSAIIGDQVGYYIGTKTGQALLLREDSKFFKRKHLFRAQQFYSKYGAKTIVIARFVPIVRTFAPAVAGAAQMSYRRFVIYNILGGVLWVWSMVLTGFFSAKLIPNLKDNIHYVIAVVIVLSLMPPIIEVIKRSNKK